MKTQSVSTTLDHIPAVVNMVMYEMELFVQVGVLKVPTCKGLGNSIRMMFLEICLENIYCQMLA